MKRYKVILVAVLLCSTALSTLSFSDEPVAPSPGAKKPQSPQVRKAIGLLEEARRLGMAGRPQDAVARQTQAVEILRRELGDSLETAEALAELGYSLGVLRRAAEQLPVEKEALAMRRRLISGDHPDLAKSISNVSYTLRMLRRSDEALPLAEEAIGMLRRLFPSGHFGLAMSLNNKAEMLVVLKRPDEALPLNEEALAMFRSLFKGDHPAVAGSLEATAFTLHALKRLDDALKVSEEALGMRRRLVTGDHPDVAKSLGGVAAILQALGRLEEALRQQEMAVAMLKRLFPGDSSLVATVVLDMAELLDNLKRPKSALPLKEQALAMNRRLSSADHPSVATSLNSLARTLEALGRWDSVILRRQEALAMYRRLYPGDHPVVADTLVRLSNRFDAMGSAEQGLPRGEEALAMRRRLFNGDHSAVAQSANNVAVLLNSVGRSADALPLNREALSMYRRLHKGDHPDVAVGLGNLASTLLSLGRTASALPLMKKTLAMQRRLHPGDHENVATSLDNLGTSLSAAGQHSDALPVRRQALAMFKRLFKGDRREVAVGLGNLAQTFTKLKRAKEALPLCERALAMLRRMSPVNRRSEAISLHRLAFALESLDRPAEAMSKLGEAWAIASRLSPFDRYIHGSSLGARLLRDGRAEEAVEPLTTAVVALASMRTASRGLRSQERAQFVGSLREDGDPHALLVRAHLALDHPLAALDMLERGRGREMLDLMLRGQVDPVSEAKALAEQRGDEKALLRLNAAIRDRTKATANVVRRAAESDKARARGDVTVEKARTLAAAESSARHDLLQVLSQLQGLVKDSIPEANAISPQEVQALLGPDERLIAYDVHGDLHDSYIFLVSRTAVRAFPLRSGKHSPTATQLRRRVSDYLKTIASTSGGEPTPAAQNLFNTLVPSKVWQEIKKARRVYLVGDDILHALPFEALVVGEKDGKAVLWLDDGPPIAYVSSGSALSWQRSRRDEQRQGAAADASLVAVGDPVFAGSRTETTWPVHGVFVRAVTPGGQAERLRIRPGDVLTRYGGTALTDVASLRAALGAAKNLVSIPVRLSRGTEKIEVKGRPGPLGIEIALEPPNVAGPAMLKRGQVALKLRNAKERGRRLIALPGTREELDGIRTAFPDKDRVKLLLGREATEARLTESASEARFLHFATHGIVDETQTASFSSLALTMPMVPVPGDDGFLTLTDLLTRWRGRLEKTEMVVLSACNTQKGKAQSDEGVFALPWGFHFAGCPTVVATLWQVPDLSTPRLMQEFYRRVVEKKGDDKLDALVAAKRLLRRIRPHPFYWAPFVLLGDPR